MPRSSFRRNRPSATGSSSATVTYVTERDDAVTVTIVGVDEADMAAGKISIGSPVALALLQARRGDEVSVRTPRGRERLEVVDIVYPDR